MLEDDYEFDCPYCGAFQSIRLDSSGGKEQQFVSDCEVCCQPILMKVVYESGEVFSFTAEREND